MGMRGPHSLLRSNLPRDLRAPQDTAVPDPVPARAAGRQVRAAGRQVLAGGRQTGARQKRYERAPHRAES